MARIVLVADDSPTIQKRAMGILKGEGFEVETVSNGVAAIKRLAVLRPVVVLADVSMPGRDGYEVCDFVKKSPELSQVPVLLVASDMEPYDNQRGAHVKADGVIKKPFEARELISSVVKFAEQFEAATISIADVSIAPPPSVGAEREFSLGNSAQDEAPTLVQPAEADFSEHGEGMAFAAPVGDDAHPFTFEAHSNESNGAFAAPLPSETAFPESPFAIPETHSTEQTLVAETPLELNPFASAVPHDAAEVPSFMEHLTGAPPEPVFIDERPEHAPVPSEDSVAVGTAIFHTPLDLGQPEVMDEISPAPTHLEAADLPVMEPQFITEEAEDGSGTSHEHLHDHPHDHSHEHPHDHPHVHPPVGATSLDSFSLDDAAAGQVRFASEQPEVVYAAPAEEASALEAPPMETAPETTTAAAAEGGTQPEVVYADPLPPESEPEVVYAEPAVLESAPNESHTETTPPEVHAASAAFADFSPETTLAGVHPGISPFEPADERGARDDAKEIAPVPELIVDKPNFDEAAHDSPKTAAAEPVPEVAAEESHLPVAAPIAALAGITALGAAVEAIHAEMGHQEPAPEPVEPAAAKPESADDTVHVTDIPTESAADVEAQPPAKVILPPPAIDADTLYTIVLKVVMKMAPPMLTEEAVAQIAKHLAQEIAVELSLDASKPPATLT